MARYLTFTVEGCGQFPIDMLRHDACYPANSESAVSIIYCDRCSRELTKEPRQVKLVTRIERDFKPEPTSDRWHSFGWKIVKQTKY